MRKYFKFKLLLAKNRTIHYVSMLAKSHMCLLFLFKLTESSFFLYLNIDFINQP